MKQLDYKRQAQNLYSNKEFYEAYETAWNLSFNEFVKWYTDSKGKRKRNKRNYKNPFFYDPFFYDNFIVTKRTDWLNQKYALNLWRFYLRTQKEPLKEFELYVAHNNPKLFCLGYKYEKVFLNKERLDFIQSNDFPSSIKKELEIWNYIFNRFEASKEAIKREFTNIESKPQEVLMTLLASFETFIFKNPNDNLRWQFAGEALSWLVAITQEKHDLKSVKVTHEELFKIYFDSVIFNRGQKLFSCAYQHILLLDHINRYVFEPGLKVTIDSKNNLIFSESKEFNEQWSNDELRYKVNEQTYYNYGELQFAELKNENKIKFVNDNISTNNQLGNSRQLAIKQAVYDLGIRDEDLMHNTLPTLDVIISFLHGIAWRKLETFENPLRKLSKKGLNTYGEAIMRLIDKRKAAEIVLISRKDELFNSAINVGLKCDEQEFFRFLDLFSYEGSKNILGGLSQKVSLWQKPFIQIGDFVISPFSVLTSFTGLYTISESILRNFQPQNGRRIETQLIEMYKDKNWTTYEKSNNQKHGDVDVVMEDDWNIILIQLKRTTQKTNTLELHNQTSQDRTAIRQLTEAKKNFNPNKNVHLWYVTTAFEKINTTTEGVLRVSYQDLINIRRFMIIENLKFNSLIDFIKYVKEDTFYSNGRNVIE
ncbi:hypothetical protein [Corallibacter sp.]|uniref:hypothetical protein n=1 Tax=Corallibacter sp. TaxID=2038084 RepID=UPI003AB62B3F